jgi:hypothetical protein
MNHDTLPIIFAVFVNNRKCAIDEFKCVNRIRKSALSRSWCCTDISVCRLCRTDIFLFQIGTDYNPQQSSYLVIDCTFFAPSHVIAPCRLATVIQLTSQDRCVGTRNNVGIVSPPRDWHPVLISLRQNKPIIWAGNWISWVQQNSRWMHTFSVAASFFDTRLVVTRRGSHFIYNISYIYFCFSTFLSHYTNQWLLVWNVIAQP